MNLGRKELRLHIIAWTLWLFIQSVLFPFRGPTLLLYIISPIQFYGAYIIVFYIVSHYILPRFWPTKISSLVTSVAILFLLFASFRLLMFYYVLPSLDDGFVFDKSISYYRFVRTCFVWFLQYTFFASAYFAFKRKNEVERALIEAEYSFLKSQFNPHFLFNTLSYLYTKVVSVSEDGAKAILLLSDIMRYSLQEERSDHMVPLHAELNHLKNYIDLIKLRNNNEIFVDLKVQGHVSDKLIIPLVLIPPVENAFKHGKNDDALFPLSVIVRAEVDYLKFIVKNKKNRNINGSIYSHRIGSKNLMRRLTLGYGESYHLNVCDEEDYYTFELVIKNQREYANSTRTLVTIN